MKKGYIVGLFFISIIVIGLIGCILWNRHKGEQQDPIQQEKTGQTVEYSDLSQPEPTTDEETNMTDSVEKTVNMQQGYVIYEKDGYLCIYRASDFTLYYESDIKLEDLPVELQDEIKNGKFMDSEIDVYHFLESYSS